MPGAIVQTLAFQVVRFSGMTSSTSASPWSLAVTLAAQSAVSAKLERTVGAIVGVQINTDCRDTDLNTFNVKTQIKSGGTESAGAAQAIALTNYVTTTRISETDPNTGSAWSAAAINAVQFGVEVG